MTKATWTAWRGDAHAAWSAIPDELQHLLAETDDLNDVALSVHRLRLAGLDVTRPEIFALAVEGARTHPDNGIPAGLGPRLYRPGEYRKVVYYARIGNRVKIGWTTDLTQRMRTLGPEQVMATEPGGPKREAERHRQFASLRTHGEWFRLEEPLVSHIASLAASGT